MSDATSKIKILDEYLMHNMKLRKIIFLWERGGLMCLCLFIGFHKYSSHLSTSLGVFSLLLCSLLAFLCAKFFCGAFLCLTFIIRNVNHKKYTEIGRKREKKNEFWLRVQLFFLIFCFSCWMLLIFPL